MLVISGGAENCNCWQDSHVSISQSRCLSFQDKRRFACRSANICVSISQSRCLSFQVPGTKLSGGSYGKCFNLAIEMLVISGGRKHSVTLPNSLSVSISQSRCLSFQGNPNGYYDYAGRNRQFQSRNRDACHFRADCLLARGRFVLSFQSRNRDACHFRQAGRKTRYRPALTVSISQSRCLSFQG